MKTRILAAVLAALFALPAFADYQIKDGTGAAKFFKTLGTPSGASGDGYVPLHGLTDISGNSATVSGAGILYVDLHSTTANTVPVYTKMGDGTNAVTVETSGGDAASNTQNRLSTSDHLSLFNSSTWDRAVGGLTGVQTSKTGMQNSIPMMQYNSSAPTPATGNVLPFQADSIGNLKVTSPVATTFHTAQLSVGTSAANFSSSATASGVTVKAKAGNTAIIYVGVSGVTTSTGYEMSAGDSVFVPVSNANLIYCISGSAGQGATEVDN